MSQLPTGKLGDCPCAGGAPEREGTSGLGDVVLAGNVGGQIPRAPRIARARKPRSKGRGDHCVYSHKNRLVHCYEDRGVAERVAESFTKRGRAGTAFHVAKRKKDD